jgi:hypothetical protein
MAGTKASTAESPAAADPWGAVWERLAGAADGLMGQVAADRERAPALLAELLAEPPAVREHMAVTLEGAERALHRAACHVAASPDPLEEAWFYRLRARLRRDQGNLGRAVALQMQAVERLGPLARPPLVAEALVELAALHLAARDRPRTLAALLAAAGALGAGAECLADCAEPAG